MEWIDLYTPDNEPTDEQIAAFIDSDLWGNLNTFLQENYGVEHTKSFSACSGQPGWNVKYKKAGRSLCTLYPMKGYFIALVVIGSKEYEEALETIPMCSEYTRELFENTQHSAGGRWLMINVTNEAILEDAKRLIQVRRKITTKTKGK